MLQLEMTDGNTPVEELYPLLEALRKKRRYFRFKQGTFLDLTDAAEWQPLAQVIAENMETTGKEEWRHLADLRAGDGEFRFDLDMLGQSKLYKFVVVGEHESLNRWLAM